MSTTTMKQPMATAAAANDPETFMMMKSALVEAVTGHFDSSPTKALCLGFGHFMNRNGEKLDIAVMPSGTSPPYKQRVGVQYFDMSPFQWVYSTQLNRWLVDVGNCPHIFYDATFKTIVLHEVYIPTANVAPYVCGFLTGFEKAVPLLNMKDAFDHIKEKEALELAKVKSEWQDLNDTESDEGEGEKTAGEEDGVTQAVGVSADPITDGETAYLNQLKDQADYEAAAAGASGALGASTPEDEDDQKPDKSVPPTTPLDSEASHVLQLPYGVAGPTPAPAAPAAADEGADGLSTPDYSSDPGGRKAANDTSGGRKVANDAVKFWERQVAERQVAESSLGVLADTAAEQPKPQPPKLTKTVALDHNGRMYREYQITQAFNRLTLTTPAGFYLLLDCAMFVAKDGFKEVMHVEPEQVIKDGKKYLHYEFKISHMRRYQETVYFTVTSAKIEFRAIQNVRSEMNPNNELPNWTSFIDYLHECLEKDKTMLTDSLAKRGAELAEEDAKHRKRKADEMADEMAKVEQVKKDEQMAKELAEADAKAPPPPRSKSGRPSKPPMRMQATNEGKVDATFKPGMFSPFNFNLTQEFVQERVDEIHEAAIEDAFSVANEVYEHSLRTQMIYQFGINTFDDLIFKYGVEFGAMDRMDVEVAVVKARKDAVELAAFNEYVESIIDWDDDAHIKWMAEIYPTHPRLLMHLANTEQDLARGMYDTTELEE